MRRVRETDLPAVQAYLEARVDQAMFPLSNLRRYGLDGEGPYGPGMWAHWTDNTVAGVLTVTRNHTVMANVHADLAEPIVRELGQIYRIVGPTTTSRPLIERFGLANHDLELDRDERQFSLGLNDLIIPEGRGDLRPIEEGDRSTLVPWHVAYNVETLGADPESFTEMAERVFEAQLQTGWHMVLAEGNDLLAMTGFNARLPQIVQIGGVFTPPNLRNEGLARRAVALHLAKARSEGVERATLFASGEAAARAYRAIGFEDIGTWTLFLLKEAVDV